MIKEFKKFLMRGNIIDLAVAVVIGAAFGKVVASFVADVITPPLGLLLGNVDFSDMKMTLQKASEGVEAVTLNYGMFFQTIINFIIIGFSIFMVLKAYNATKKKEEAPAAPPAPSKEEVLLAEIRDLLKNK